MKNGGVLDHQLHSIEVFCRPADLPERLELDISGLGLGDAVHVSDLTLPEGVETHTDADVVIAMVAEPRVAATAEGEEETAGAAPAAAEEAPTAEGE